MFKSVSSLLGKVVIRTYGLCDSPDRDLEVWKEKEKEKRGLKIIQREKERERGKGSERLHVDKARDVTNGVGDVELGHHSSPVGQADLDRGHRFIRVRKCDGNSGGGGGWGSLRRGDAAWS